MKTLLFSKDELETIKFLLWQNPCRSGCVLDYKKVDCDAVDKNGVYKCKLKRNVASLEEKLGIYE